MRFTLRGRAQPGGSSEERVDVAAAIARALNRPEPVTQDHTEGIGAPAAELPVASGPADGIVGPPAHQAALPAVDMSAAGSLPPATELPDPGSRGPSAQYELLAPDEEPVAAVAEMLAPALVRVAQVAEAAGPLPELLAPSEEVETVEARAAVDERLAVDAEPTAPVGELVTLNGPNDGISPAGTADPGSAGPDASSQQLEGARGPAAAVDGAGAGVTVRVPLSGDAADDPLAAALRELGNSVVYDLTAAVGAGHWDEVVIELPDRGEPMISLRVGETSGPWRASLHSQGTLAQLREQLDTVDPGVGYDVVIRSRDVIVCRWPHRASDAREPEPLDAIGSPPKAVVAKSNSKAPGRRWLRRTESSRQGGPRDFPAV